MHTFTHNVDSKTSLIIGDDGRGVVKKEAVGFGREKLAKELKWLLEESKKHYKN